MESSYKLRIESLSQQKLEKKLQIESSHKLEMKLTTENSYEA